MSLLYGDFMQLVLLYGMPCYTQFIATCVVCCFPLMTDSLILIDLLFSFVEVSSSMALRSLLFFSLLLEFFPIYLLITRFNESF